MIMEAKYFYSVDWQLDPIGYPKRVRVNLFETSCSGGLRKIHKIWFSAFSMNLAKFNVNRQIARYKKQVNATLLPKDYNLGCIAGLDMGYQRY